MSTPIYDNAIELQLNALICELEENPMISLNPVESSSYKGFTLADGHEGFLRHIKQTYFDKFLAYINAYKKDCINAYAVKTNFIPTIKRLIAHYEQAENEIYDSPIRNEWAKYFNSNGVSDDGTGVRTIEDQESTKQAYQFFYNASSVELSFLMKLLEELKEHLAELDTGNVVPEPEYYFTILPEFRMQRHNILIDIHKNLKTKGYVDCTPNAFKKIFTTAEPKPIKWFNSQRSLTYMIKILTGRLLVEKSNPSNAYITERYFHILKNGHFLHPKKLRHDRDPAKKVVEFLDQVIDDAITTSICGNNFPSCQ